MDNNFYDRNTSRTKRREKNKNVMTRVIAMQLILSLAISGILFAICRTDSNLSNNIKAYYNEICKTDIAVSGIIDVFKGVVKQTFAPTIQNEDNTKDDSGEKINFSPVFYQYWY